MLHLYVDLGLTLVKLGEEARVPLAGFTLDGGDRKWLRKMVRSVEEKRAHSRSSRTSPRRSSTSCARSPTPGCAEKKHARERVLPRLLRRAATSAPAGRPGAEGDRIVAFANSAGQAQDEEISVDLMRHLPDAPPGVMDYMFIDLML